MRRLSFFCALVFGSALHADTSTEAFLQSCRDLTEGRPGGVRCEAILEGALGAFSLIGKDFYPVSAELGYCLMPDMTPLQAATVIVRYAEDDPDCARLAHFSMCMNLAFRKTYPGSC